MLVLAAPATVVGTGDEVAPNEVEWRLPATNDDPVTPAKRLEVLVVADGMVLVLGHVLDEIDAPSGGTERRQAPVVADRGVAGRAARQLGLDPRRRAVRQPAAPAEADRRGWGGRPALEAGRPGRRAIGGHRGHVTTQAELHRVIAARGKRMAGSPIVIVA